jgi:NTP pyrophosphatase (non-canonical NTP hydrolase)
MTWSDEVVQWQRSVFGETNPPAAFARAAVEFDELRDKVAAFKAGDMSVGYAQMSEEAADVCIVLAAFAASFGIDLAEAIEAKMARNRARRWVVTGEGCGQHVPDDHSE